MPDPSTSVRVPVADLYRFYEAVFGALGVPGDDLKLVADSLIDADLHGVDSHGIDRIPTYVERIRTGGIKLGVPLETIRDDGNTVVLSGNDGIGQVVATKAMRLAVERASQHGLAAVAVRRSNHLGTLAYYARMALEAQQIGLAITGVASTLVPVGGSQAVLGSNPWSIAIPAGRHAPVVVDIANGAIISTLIRDSAELGQPLPPHSAVDEHAEVTQDPSKAVGILPIGGHKGYGLTLAWELLASVLTGALYSTQITRYESPGTPKGIGHFFLTLRVDRFMPVEQFVERVDDLQEILKGSSPKVRIPGERSARSVGERQRDGVPIPPHRARRVAEAVKDLGVDLPFGVEN